MTTTQLDWRIWVTAGVAVALAAAAVVSRWMRRPDDPDETERRRRSYVSQVGRIVEGHIIELVERAVPAGTDPAADARSPHQAGTAGANGLRKLVCYSYSISGVSYETAQDLTGLEARVSFDRLVAGQPASVKYDPANPTNSILLADDWSGLH